MSIIKIKIIVTIAIIMFRPIPILFAATSAGVPVDWWSQQPASNDEQLLMKEEICNLALTLARGLPSLSPEEEAWLESERNKANYNVSSKNEILKRIDDSNALALEKEWQFVNDANLICNKYGILSHFQFWSAISYILLRMDDAYSRRLINQKFMEPDIILLHPNIIVEGIIGRIIIPIANNTK